MVTNGEGLVFSHVIHPEAAWP